MDSEEYRSYIKRKIALYTSYETEDLTEGKNEAAYIAKVMKDCYADALEKFDKLNVEA